MNENPLLITSIYIEYIQNAVPFKECEEFVVVFNGSSQKHDLEGWKLQYEDMDAGGLLHTHHFYKIRGSFDPGERLCILSSMGADGFRNFGEESRFPGPHWDLFTDRPSHLIDRPHVRVKLFDEKGNEIASMSVNRTKFVGTSDRPVQVFVGHGRSPQWRTLRDHLQDQHGMKVEAYEVGPRAGLSVKEVLETMIKQSTFALLILTGEDLDAEGQSHARENVIHELGLFQGALGFTKAIALLEEGVSEFSNIQGLTQIRFSKGRIRESFGDVIATICREIN